MAHLRRMKIRGFHPRVVLDVGAAHGDWTASCQRVFPDAHYVMVEPLMEYERELSALVRPNRVEYVRAAAGREKTSRPLLIPDDPGGSSFLPASRDHDPTFKRSVVVPILPLSSLDVPKGSTLLKLDVQGYELEVIAGAGRLLDDVEVIIAECSLYPTQQGLPLIHEIVRDLTDRGYSLYDLSDEYRWPSGTLSQVDLIFVSGESDLRQPDSVASDWQC